MKAVLAATVASLATTPLHPVGAFHLASPPPASTSALFGVSVGDSSSEREPAGAPPLNENNNDNDNENDTAKKYCYGATADGMSRALPFMACPPVLLESDLAGNAGFDPLGLAFSQEQLRHYREVEIKHARLAMLAAAGVPLSELYQHKLADSVGLSATLMTPTESGVLTHIDFSSVSPTWWGFCLGLTAAIENYGHYKVTRTDSRPGDLGFDPAGLYPADAAGQRRMQTAEIKHGRVAMLAIVAFFVQEHVTGLGVIDETPVFFQPLSETFPQLFGSGAAGV